MQQYSHLADDDECYFFGERTSGRNWAVSPTNQLIANFKRAPEKIAESPNGQALLHYKNKAINTVASGLRDQINSEWFSRITFVPIPTSKTRGDPHYCDRLERTLRLSFHASFGFVDADVRCLLRQTQNTEADHLSGGNRTSYRQLLAITEVAHEELSTPLRELVILFDDVLTSGKHFRVAKHRIREIFPAQRIVGIFIARSIHPDPADDFDELD